MNTSLPAKLPKKLKHELASLYEELANAQRAFTATCHQCGACCNFSKYDHQLWVTNLELAYLAETEGVRPVSVPGVCPYMEENRCSARTGRTIGCRVFLCEQDAAEMEALHEEYFEKLRTLAKEHGIELEYREFLEFLREFDKGSQV